jgi:hypothetical protein
MSSRSQPRSLGFLAVFPYAPSRHDDLPADKPKRDPKRKDQLNKRRNAAIFAHS